MKWYKANFHNIANQGLVIEEETGKNIAVVYNSEYTQLIANAPAFNQALQNISNFSKCQCKDQHGDNPNCAVLIAERALQE